MSDGKDKWKTFWKDKADPLTCGQGVANNDRLARELQILLPAGFSSVLEIGCGNGVLFEALGFDKVAYHGIDYSTAMIAAFQKQYPAASVSVTDFRHYEGTEGLDLIFSHGVVQYVPLADFEVQIARSAKLLKQGGHVVHAGILRKSCRAALMGGELWEEPGNPVKNLLRIAAESLGVRRSFGHWYDIPDVRRIAKKHGFSAQFFGSLFFPYRFHVVMKKLG
jgi:SAM-dependent methyltransferase